MKKVLSSILSGYTAESLLLDYTYIEDYLERIREHSYKKNVCVFFPTLMVKNNKLYNTVHVFNSDDGDKIIYKNGLTPSEQVMMLPKKSDRIFKLNGYKLGVLICIEMENKPYEHISKDNLPDLILWPSYWGWKYHDTWGPIKRIDGKPNKCFSLVKTLKKPVIQINMASTKTSDGSVIKGGKSVLINSKNKKIGTGKYGAIDRFIVTFDGDNFLKL